MATIKIKPWSSDQGEYVLINEDDFDGNVHQTFGSEEVKTSKASKKVLSEDN